MSDDDAMGHPPLDHGSDRFDYVEVDCPPDIHPPPELMAVLLDKIGCPDCRPNLFLRWIPPSAVSVAEWSWQITMAHDETCPWLQQHEAGG